MKIATYICNLICEHDCVILPDLGAFVAANTSAKVHLFENSFVPPGREVKFNSHLKSPDQMLVKYLVQKEAVSLEEAQFRVEFFIKGIKSSLSRGDTVLFPDLGSLKQSPEGEFLFDFHPKASLNHESFGLDEFISPTVIREMSLPQILGSVKETKLENADLSDPFSLDNNMQIHLQRRLRLWKSYFLRVASVVLVFLMIGSLLVLTPQTKGKSAKNLASIFAWDAQVPSSLLKMSDRVIASSAPIKEIQAISNLGMSLIDSGPELNPQGEHQQCFHLIAGSFNREANAKIMLEELVAKGYEASISPSNSLSPFRVSYAFIQGKFNALEMLTTIRKNENPSAWLLPI